MTIGLYRCRPKHSNSFLRAPKSEQHLAGSEVKTLMYSHKTTTVAVFIFDHIHNVFKLVNKLFYSLII